jgi:hypothetical protein
MSPFEAVADDEPGTAVVEPNLATKFRYWLGWSVDERYRGWVERDIASRGFPWRLLANYLVSAAAVVLAFDALIDGFVSWTHMLGFTIAGLASTVFFTSHQRRRLLEWHEKRWKRSRERDESPDFRRFP